MNDVGRRDLDDDSLVDRNDGLIVDRELAQIARLQILIGFI